MSGRDRNGMQDGEPKRRRGLKASPAKLRQALLESGIKSQAQLADRIAELEGLENAPRNLVNKAFRGEAVDPLSIQRIARALNVQVWKIYLTAEEPDMPEAAPPSAVSREPAAAAIETDGTAAVSSATPATPVPTTGSQAGESERAAGTAAPTVAATDLSATPPSGRRTPWAVRVVQVVLPALVIIAGAWIFLQRAPSDPASATAPWVVQIAALSGPGSEQLRAALLEADLPRMRFIAAGGTAAPSNATAADSLTLAGELTQLGRFAEVRFFVITEPDARRHDLLAAIVPASRPQAAIGDLQAAVSDYLAGRAGSVLPRDAANDYLYGRMHLDAAPSELNLRRAQSRFEAALRRAPAFALAQAGLCQALAGQRWISDEPQKLADAQAVCQRAREIDSDASAVRIAHANLLSVTGRTAEASLLLEEVLALEPDSTDAALLLAGINFEEFRKSGTRSFLESAARHAHHTVTSAPNWWRTHWQLGVIEFHLGNVDAAIQALEHAARLDANDLVLVNLGVSRFCRGEVAAARDAFLEARALTENPRLGEEFLGTAAFYAGEFAQSVAYRKQAIDRMQPEGGPAIHQVWGDLGDSYRHNGELPPAIRAYERAMTILDDDIALGNATEGDRAYRAYYRLATALSSGKTLASSDVAAISADLAAAAATETEPGALVRIAIAWRMLDRDELSKRAADSAADRCTVYRNHPDLRARLAPTPGVGNTPAHGS